jgi:hypothetical protein
MAESGWGTDDLQPLEKKRKVPIWVWVTCSGCLLAAVALALVLVLSIPHIKRWAATLNDPEVQWPKVAEVLPFDERPPETDIFRLPFPGMQGWKLTTRDGQRTAILPAAEATRAAELRKVLHQPQKQSAFWPGADELEPQQGSIDVQGRALACTRMSKKAKGKSEPADSAPADPGGPYPGIAIDVTPEGSAGVVLFIVHAERDADDLDDAEVERLLAPFRIGPEH